MRKVAWCFTAAGLLLGLLHIGLTWPIYRSLNLDALWFAGSGLAIVCCGLLNWVALRNPRLCDLWPVVLADLLVAGFFATAWPVLPGPHTAAGFVIFASLACCFGVLLTKRRAVRDV